MENPEIKACPFCGGPAEVRPREDYYDFRVFCKDDKCGCSSPKGGRTFEEAQEWWNRRAGDRQPVTPETVGVKALASATGSAASSDWTRTPPDRDGQGYWWWWNGDRECAPGIVTVMWSGCSGKCFICIKDDPNTNDVDSETWSGWWKRIPDEMPPNRLI